MSTSRNSAGYRTAAGGKSTEEVPRRTEASHSERDQQVRAGGESGCGYRYLYPAIGDYSRVAYSEILDDDCKDTAAGFWNWAADFFGSLWGSSSRR